MGIAERKEREKEQRQNSIIDAAEKVFFGKGVEQATMDEVAEEAELSKGTLYLYFQNKDELLHAIVHRSLSLLYSIFKQAVDKETKGIDKLQAIGRAYFKFNDQYPDYSYMMLFHQDEHSFDDDTMDSCPFLGLCKQEANKIFELMVAVIENGIKDRSLRSDLEPMKLALALWGQTSGIMNIIKTKEKMITEMMGIDPEELIDYSFELIKNCIENKR